MSPARFAAPRQLVLALWLAIAAQFALLIAGGVLEVLAGSEVADTVFGVTSTLAFPAVGAVLLRAWPEHRISQLFAVANAGWAVNNFSGSYVRYSLGVAVLPGWEVAVWTYIWPGFLSVAAYVALLMLFPDGRAVGAFWGRLLRVIIVWAPLAAVFAAFASGPVDPTIGVDVVNPLAAPEPFGGLFVALRELALIGAFLAFIVAAISMGVRWRVSRGVVRQQLKWFAAAAAVVALGTGALAVTLAIYGDFRELPPWGRAAQELSIASPALLPIAACIAILRYRLYDIDILINRAVVYGGLSVSLVAAYVGSVLLLQAALRPFTAGSDIAVAMSTLGVVALFQPLRRRIQDAVDRRFYRSRYDAQRALDAFAQRLRDEVDLDDVREQLLAAVHGTVQPRGASVWLRGGPAP